MLAKITASATQNMSYKKMLSCMHDTQFYSIQQCMLCTATDYVSFFFYFAVDTKSTNIWQALNLMHKWFHMHARVNGGSEGARCPAPFLAACPKASTSQIHHWTFSSPRKENLWFPVLSMCSWQCWRGPFW